MDSVASAIQQQMLAAGTGKIYFISDFDFPGSEETVKKALFRLEKRGFFSPSFSWDISISKPK